MLLAIKSKQKHYIGFLQTPIFITTVSRLVSNITFVGNIKELLLYRCKAKKFTDGNQETI